MRRALLSPVFVLVLLTAGCGPTDPTGYDSDSDSLRFEGETHLRNIRQLTFGGNNAEAYWSFDDSLLIMQSDWSEINPQGCDQQFVLRADGGAMANGELYNLVSTGKGRTTCGYFLPDGRLIYASTHAGNPECPTPKASELGRYVWSIFPDFDIYAAEPDGSHPEVLIGGPGYDAEATVSPDGKYIIFTSTRSGDLELYRFDMATEEVIQLTDELGYDGGAFFSRNSDKIVWRANRPEGEDAAQYRGLLRQDAIEPSALNLFVADIDGSNPVQVTDLPGANWAPFFHPSGEQIIFASNHHTLDGGGREFDLFMVNVDGTGLSKITNSGTFDAFPMFNSDGSKLVFSSNRRADREDSRDTNVFVADWVEEPEEVDASFGVAE